MVVFFIPAEVRDSLEAQVYNPKMTSTEFAELAKLCQDQSALGSNLLSMAKSLSDQPSLQSKSSMQTKVLHDMIIMIMRQ